MSREEGRGGEEGDEGKGYRERRLTLCEGEVVTTLSRPGDDLDRYLPPEVFLPLTPTVVGVLSSEYGTSVVR